MSSDGYAMECQGERLGRKGRRDLDVPIRYLARQPMPRVRSLSNDPTNALVTASYLTTSKSLRYTSSEGVDATERLKGRAAAVTPDSRTITVAIPKGVIRFGCFLCAPENCEWIYAWLVS